MSSHSDEAKKRFNDSKRKRFWSFLTEKDQRVNKSVTSLCVHLYWTKNISNKIIDNKLTLHTHTHTFADQHYALLLSVNAADLQLFVVVCLSSVLWENKILQMWPWKKNAHPKYLQQFFVKYNSNVPNNKDLHQVCLFLFHNLFHPIHLGCAYLIFFYI